MFEQYQKTFTTYSGTDMVCSINVPNVGPVVFGELSQISYSVYREKVPVRTLGRISMKGYTRGMRTITGILGFTTFDESIVYRCLKDIKDAGYRMLMDEMPQFDVTISMANEFGAKSKMSIYGVSTYTEGMVMSVDDIMTQNVYEFYARDIDPMQRTNEERKVKYSTQGGVVLL
ncbi:virion structural protein [Bacillus subtilis]|uniref:Virion structural protein n=1 Tax=Bacillus subtilis TaxID=1423 RepID=A0A8I1WDK9_BACIU|nr:virion structural protein [Bacillus subtilis]MBO3794271.1 virion structural protein [Bacillus subtilis]MED3626592.1 virion structural protein [Bacillus subtilis]